MPSSIEKLMINKQASSTNVARIPRKPSINIDKVFNYIELNRPDLASEGYIVNHAKNETVDEYRLIKRRLLKEMDAKKGQGLALSNFILVTSAMQGDGKTFTATNLALSIAMELDRTALLIDADVMKGGVSRNLGIDADHGFVDLLSNNKANYGELIYKTDIENLSILPAGKSNMRITELFSSESMGLLCEELSHRYKDRIIIMDSPPLLQTSESQALANVIPNIVFVVSADHTPTAAVTDALSLIDRDKDVSFVLNKARVKSSGMYYYYNT